MQLQQNEAAVCESRYMYCKANCYCVSGCGQQIENLVEYRANDTPHISFEDMFAQHNTLYCRVTFCLDHLERPHSLQTYRF